MASQEETMRIVAEVVDKFSRPLRELRQNLRGVDATTGNDRLQRQFRGLKDDAKALGDGLKSSVMPALSAFNVQTLTVGGAIAAVSVSLRGLSADLNTLRFVSRETGITIDRMRQLEAAGDRVGIAGERMRAGFGTFARNMKELRAGVGGTLSELFAHGDHNVRAFASSLRGITNNEEALNRVLKFLDRITDPIDKQRFLEAFGLPAELGRMTSAQLEEYARRVGKTTAQMVEDAKKIENAWSDVKESWNNLIGGLADLGAFKLAAAVMNEAAHAAERTAKTIELLRKGEYTKAFQNELGTSPSPKNPAEIEAGIAKRKAEIERLDGVIAERKARGADVSAPSRARERLSGEILELQRELKKGTKEGASEGVQEGIRKMMLERSLDNGGGPAARVVPASYSPGASGGARSILRQFDAPSIVPDGGADRAPSDTGRVGGGIGGRADVGGRQPASVRYNNPGAQYPSARAKLFGMTGYGVIGGGHLIARFTDPAHGAASNMDLFRRSYSGMSVGAAGRKWTGNNGFGVPGYDPRMVVTPEMMDDPNFVIPFMKAIAGREAGRKSPLTPEQWRQAFDIYKAGGVKAYEARRRMMDAAKETGVIGGGGGKVEGNASVKIELNGFPKGTRTSADASGIFSDVELNRGRTMPTASEVE